MALKFFSDDVNDMKSAVFCFTGKAGLTRSELEFIAKEAGASVTKSITSRTTILVVADLSKFNHSSSKIEKAHKYNIDMIGPEEFIEICDQVRTQKACEKLTKIKITKPKPIKKNPNEKIRHSSVRRIQL